MTRPDYISQVLAIRDFTTYSLENFVELLCSITETTPQHCYLACTDGFSLRFDDTLIQRYRRTTSTNMTLAANGKIQLTRLEEVISLM